MKGIRTLKKHKAKNKVIDKMKNLLYFEEFVCPLSQKLSDRNDINVLKIRAVKTMNKFFSKEELLEPNVYYFDTEKDYDLEIKKLKIWLKEKEISLNYFLNDSEYYMEISNRIANSLGLPCLTPEQVKWVRDKVDMKNKFNEIGLSTVRYVPIESKEDIKNFFYQNKCQTIIFKPRRAMNSKNVYKLCSINDINNLDIEIKPNEYMVETFCYGHEWSIESLVQDGVVLDSYLSYLPNATIWASIENKLHAHMTCINHPRYFEMTPKKYVQKIVDGFELKNGTMTIEIFVMSDGTMLASELGWRLPGGRACEAHSLSYGFDIWNSLIDIAVGEKVNLKYSDKKICVGTLRLPNLEGIIKYVTPIEELLSYEGVTDGKLFAKIGEFQKKRRVGSDCSGWVQVSGIDTFDVLHKMQVVYDNFRIEIVKDKCNVRR